MYTQLLPSQIYYSQDSIANSFDSSGRHGHKLIGETLDDICEGRCNVHDIPMIRVMMKNGRWVTSDNRRLWVFRQLERLGVVNNVMVQQTTWIHADKMTSKNDGVSVRVRGDPGGRWYRERFMSDYNSRGSFRSFGQGTSPLMRESAKIRATSSEDWCPCVIL